jgi:PAS domain S-box-containing protein
MTKTIPRRLLFFVGLLPFITFLLALTTKLHGLIWSEYHIQQAGSFSAIKATYGLWFWVHVAYSYVVLVAGTALLVRALWRRQGLYRGQMIAMLVAVLAPWIGNALYLTGNSPIPHLDLMPFAFTVSIAALAWAIFGFHLMDVAPLARERVIDALSDGMVVLNMRDRIVDMNSSAARMIGVPIPYAIGKPVTEIFQPWSQLVEKLQSLMEGQDKFFVGTGEAQRNYEVRVSALKDPRGQFAGRIIMLRVSSADEIPQPRYDTHNTAPRPAVTVPHHEKPTQSPPDTGWLLTFISTPIKTDLQIPTGINPKWYQARERSFTLILRLSAVLGSIALLVAPSFTTLDAGLPFAIIIALIWFLGLARNINFQVRAVIFLVLVYVMSFVEIYNFGFSVESFTFFMALVVSATLLMERKGGIVTIVISVATLCAFAVAIGGGYYQPINAHEGILVPSTIQRGLTSAIVFAASAAAMLGSATILMESLNNAWRLESQALNLLQQERDLLEQRVNERTRSLSEAHDQAVIVSNHMRKYYRAMEQSGATIVITDRNGNIEYANPMFEQSTGYKLSESIGKNPRVLQSGSHPKEYYESLWQTISTGNVWHGEFLNKRKDGSLFWESATIAPVLNSNGVVSNYVAIKEDVSAKKQLQDSLELAHDQALEASRLKSQLLSRVSHELRTPLGERVGLRGIAALRGVWRG